MIRIRAFSLIELMVVIAIAGILSAVAIPTYKTYQLRALVSEKIKPLESIINDLKLYHSLNGSFPASFDIGGVTVSGWDNIDATTTFGDIGAMAYVPSADSQGFQLLATIKGLNGIPDYIEPSIGQSSPGVGSRAAFGIGLRVDNGIIQYVCGHANDSTSLTNSVPYEYLPEICSCTHTSLFKEDGTGCDN